MQRSIFICFAVVVLVSGRPKLDEKPAADDPPVSKSTGSDAVKSPTTKAKIPNGPDVRFIRSTSKLATWKTSILKTTEIPTTFPIEDGCFYEGKRYLPGSDISRGFDGKSWCYGTYCDQSGQIVVWDNFRCNNKPSTPTTIPERPTTFPASPTPTINPIPTTTARTTWRRVPSTINPKGVCFFEGKWYTPGQISSEYDGTSWCHGYYCDASGEVVAWDDFRCNIKTSGSHPTTLPVRTTPIGCYYNGRWFPPDTEISRGSSYGWCFGTYCNTQGNVIAWDSWSCSTTAPVPTTSFPHVPEPKTTEPPRPKGCIFQGQLYDLGSEISQIWLIGGVRCYGRRCSDDGQIVTWLDFGCKAATETFLNNDNTNGCRYRGHFYHRGIEMFRKTLSGRCYESACQKNGLQKWKSLSCTKERKFLLGYGRSRMCSYLGQSYPRGSVVYSRSLYKSHGFGWCVGAKCGKNGRITAWGPAWAPGYC